MLTRWFELDPLFDDLARLGQELSRPVVDPRREAGVPRLDVQDSGDHLVVTAAMPGVRAEDIQLHVVGDELRLGITREITVPEGYRALRRERRSWRFDHTFRLPVPVDPDTTSAQLSQGLLRLELSKRAEAVARQIAVQVA